MKEARPGGTTPSSKAGVRRARGAKWRLPAMAGALVSASLALVACLHRPLCEDCRPVTTNAFVETVPQRRVNKIDLLFVIDNSRSMADKQLVLAAAVPDLVRRLVSPDCVALSGGGRAKPDAAGKCAAGFEPEFQSVKDIHIGVVTSSLGGPGCGAVPEPPRPDDTAEEKEAAEQITDNAHLLGTRGRFVSALAKVQNTDPPAPAGFLDWNPSARPGQSADAFTTTFTVMTKAAGEIGCGYEAQLESFYRFLIDPAPPRSFQKVPCGPGMCTVPVGVDEPLLNQRRAFLRPDSLVAIVLLTDENDCSIQEVGQGYLAASNGTLPSGSAACAVNPNDPCCYMCGTTPPAGCAEDKTCKGVVPEELDHPNLRCHAQKKRFGYDFLYPTARYVNALKERKLCTSRPDLDAKAQCNDEDGIPGPDIRDNPLYLGPVDVLPRLPELVFFAGIVGVPWQDILATKDADGVDYDPNELHFKRAKAMNGDGTWDKILGTPRPPNGAPPIPPTDTLMVESVDVRGGLDGQGNPLGPPGGAWNANVVNGHEWNTALLREDLQYACTFPLPPDPVTGATTRTCTGPYCDCQSYEDEQDDPQNPLCQDPATNRYGATQFRAKAYPALRELEVLKGYGDNSIVASICARNLDRPERQDYGYRPAVDAIVDRLKEELSDKCLPRVLKKDARGDIPCSIVEVLPSSGQPRVCEPARGRLPADAEVVEGVYEQLRARERCDVEGQPACTTYHLCELQRVDGNCHKATTDQPQAGWCYIDPATQPEDDASLVKRCPSDKKRIIRFVDKDNATPAPGAEVVIACFGATGSEVTPVPAAQ